MPELTPHQTSEIANVTNVKTAQIPNAVQYGNSVRGATSHATVGGLKKGCETWLGTRRLCWTATMAWS
jgi:hypothetical protein